jgi:hypothetical protein
MSVISGTLLDPVTYYPNLLPDQRLFIVRHTYTGIRSPLYQHHQVTGKRVTWNDNLSVFGSLHQTLVTTQIKAAGLIAGAIRIVAFDTVILKYR